MRRTGPGYQRPSRRNFFIISAVATANMAEGFERQYKITSATIPSASEVDPVCPLPLTSLKTEFTPDQYPNIQLSPCNLLFLLMYLAQLHWLPAP